MTTSLHGQVIRQLVEIVGDAHVLLPSHEDFSRYEKDETEDLRFSPSVVTRPSSVLEIQEIVRLAEHHRVPIVPRGGGTGLSGGALATRGGIVLSLERFSHILEIDPDNFFAVVQPGVITEHLHIAVEELGLFYPPDPASRGSCTIGGNVAENAGGPRALKYGVTKDYVYGLEAVVSGGSAVRFGGKRLKDVTGYNLVQLFVGSEGTLGVITELTLRLLPKPQFRRTLLAPFGNLSDAAKAVPAIMSRGVVPCALEFLEQDCLRAIQNHLGEAVRFSNFAAVLLIELDGNHEAVLDREMEIVGEVLERFDADNCYLAETTAQQNEIWAMRRAAGEAVKSICPYKEEDTVVPRSRLPELVEGVHHICDRWNLKVICYGHAGDGNLHCNILKADMSDYAWEHEIHRPIEEIFQLTASLGGTISGEHGIGHTQTRYLPLVQTPEEIRIQKWLKEALDPKEIFNPGKILP